MDIIFRTFHAQNRHRRRTQAESPAAGSLDSPSGRELAAPHDPRVGNQPYPRTLLVAASAGVHPRLFPRMAGHLFDRRTRQARPRRPLPLRLEPSVRGHGRHDARRQADRPFRRRAGGGQRPADVPRTAAPAVDSGEQARRAERLLRPEVRRRVLRRSAGPDLSRGSLLAPQRRRGDRPRVENQLPEKGLRLAAADRSGLRRRASVEVLLPRLPNPQGAGRQV